VYFGSWFQRFQSTITWPHCIGACEKTAYQDKETHVGGRCSPHGKQREKGMDHSHAMLATRPKHLKFPPPPSSAELKTEPHMSFGGDARCRL
jgi:hypothetical protein